MTEELVALIGEHLNKYPLAEPQDIVKLLYQREFGPAHAISDPARAEAWLKEEYAAIVQEPGPALENIGNGYARLCLKRLDANGITPEQAAEWFVLSAAPAGDKTGFENALRMLADDKRTDALLPGMSGYIARYIEAGCPAVHHSETYRRAYSPAYRVVKTELCRGLIQPK